MASCGAERDVITVTRRHRFQLPKGDYGLSKMLEVSQIKDGNWQPTGTKGAAKACRALSLPSPNKTAKARSSVQDLPVSLPRGPLELLSS